MPARAAPRRHTYTHLGHTSSSSSFSSPCAVLCASFHPPPSSWNLEQVCSLADYCGPLSNSRHVKAIPGILLIVMQSRPRGKPNGIIILSRSRQCRGDCAADAPSVLFPLTHVTYATAARVARVQAGRRVRHSAAIVGIFGSIETIDRTWCARFDAVETSWVFEDVENERGVGDRKMEKLNWILFFLCNYQKLEILHTSVNTRNSVRYTRKHKQFITVAVSTFNLTVSRIHFTKILESFPLRKFRETSQIINHSGPGINLRLEYLLKRGNLSRFPTELGRCSRYKPVSICNYMHPPPLRYSQSRLFSRATVIFHGTCTTKSLEFEFEARAPHQTQPEEKTYLRFLRERSPRLRPGSRDMYLRVYRNPLETTLRPLFLKTSWEEAKYREQLDVSAIELDKNGGKSKGHGFRLWNYEVVRSSRRSRKERLARERYIRIHRMKLLSWKKTLMPCVDGIT